jgi:hypothetical protein
VHVKSQTVDAPFYPDCSTCGHHASGVVAGCCTAFDVYPEGDPRGMAGYCAHRCTEDPIISRWLHARQR